MTAPDLKCPVCEGKGARLNGILPCSLCSGTGKQTVEQFIAEVERRLQNPNWNIIIPNMIHALIALLREAREDSRRLDWLDNFAQNEGVFESCFELDGGIHLTLHPVGGPENGIAFRDQNDLRQAIDAAMKAQETPNAKS